MDEQILEIQSLKNRLSNLETEMEKVTKRVDRHGDEIDDLKLSLTELKTTIGRIDLTVGAINDKLNNLWQKPAQRWDTVVNQIIALVVAAVVGAILVQIGL